MIPSDKRIIDLTWGELSAGINELLEKHIQVQKSEDTKGRKLDIAELATYLNCTPATVHNYKKQGMPYYRSGRTVFFYENEVLEFMKKKRMRLI